MHGIKWYFTCQNHRTWFKETAKSPWEFLRHSTEIQSPFSRSCKVSKECGGQNNLAKEPSKKNSASWFQNFLPCYRNESIMLLAYRQVTPTPVKQKKDPRTKLTHLLPTTERAVSHTLYSVKIRYPMQMHEMEALKLYSKPNSKWIKDL